MEPETNNHGKLIASLSIMTAFTGSEEIEFYMNGDKGIIRYINFQNNGTLYQTTKLINLDKDHCWRLMGLLEFPEPGQKEQKYAGCDGVDYELIIYHEDGDSVYEWWCDAPRGWEEVVSATNKLLSMVGCKEKVEMEERG